MREKDAHLSRWFRNLLGVDLADARPGEIVVVRDARRDEPEQVGACERMTPICLCVGDGRAVVSTCRFMQRVVEDWAEGFPAPEMLLRNEFVRELVRHVERAMGGSASAVEERVMVRTNAACQTHDAPADGAAAGPSSAPISCCDVADRDAVQRLLHAGYRERARCVRIQVDR